MLWLIQFDSGATGWMEVGTGVLFDGDGAPVTDPVCYTTIDTAPTQPEWYVEPPPPEPELPPIDPAVYEREMAAVVQLHLDQTAQAHGYDGILSAVSYQLSPHPKFGPEGQAFAAWRDAVWSACYEILAQCLAQLRLPPTAAELLAELPVLDL